MQIKHLTLEVSSGDITKERCDAVVNSSNSSFSLKSGKLLLYIMTKATLTQHLSNLFMRLGGFISIYPGVSKAILDAAGIAVERECQQIS